MDPRFELLLRSVSVFLSVYFTVGWGEKNSIANDIPVLMLSVIAAILVRYYD